MKPGSVANFATYANFANLAFWVIATIAGCGKQPNAEYCGSALHAGEDFCKQNFPDAGVDAAIRCTSTTDCPGLVCDVANGICVECIAPGFDATDCPPTSPICEAGAESCRHCELHSECPSSACLPDGTCAAADQVEFVSDTGADTNDCLSETTGCRTFLHTFAVGRPYLKADGAFTETVVMDLPSPLTILAEPKTTLTGAINGAIIEIKGGAVEIWDLDINGGQGASGDGAVAVTGAAATVGLHRVIVRDGATLGVLVKAGALTMQASTISHNTAGGIDIKPGVVRFDIENNFIVDNGSPGGQGTPFGGANLEASPGGSTFAWNTLALNQAKTVGAVTCGAQGINGAGNLLWQNVNTGGTPPLDPKCGFTTSLSEPSTSDPHFVNSTAAPYDFHLTKLSTDAIDRAGLVCPLYDIDGENRPYPKLCDFGADEFY